MILSLLALTFATAPSYGQDPIALTCATDMPTTKFELVESGEDVILKVRHVNGTDFMPIHEGIIVPHDFDYLAGKAKMLTKMGSYAEFKFPRKRCKIWGKGLISCGDGEKKQFGDVTMQALNFITKKVRTSFFDMEVDSWKVTLSIWSPDFSPVMDVTMEYGDTNCKSSF